jgi:hypothetical protein
MRSVLVFRSLARMSNRYELCKVVAKATRRLHRPDTRMPDTINEALIFFHETNPEAEVSKEGRW